MGIRIYFENIIKSIFNQLKISNDSFQFSIEIPGTTLEYKCDIDSIFNIKGAVLSTHNSGQPYASLIAFIGKEDLKEIFFCNPENDAKIFKFICGFKGRNIDQQ